MNMLLKLTVALSALLSLACADVKFTNPAAGTTISGTTLEVTWSDSGTAPLLSDLHDYQLFLCTGGNDPASIVALEKLETNGDYSNGNSFTATIAPTLGGNIENAYFLKMVSACDDGWMINYSSRFTLTSMSGIFPAIIQSALESVSGTAGPASQNPLSPAKLELRQADQFAVPYTMQTGPTRFAPMAQIPGSEITMKNHVPQYPASSYSVWTTIGGAPNAVFTVTQYNPTVVSSVEPTFAAAAMPSDSDMQKFLNRWKD